MICVFLVEYEDSKKPGDMTKTPPAVEDEGQLHTFLYAAVGFSLLICCAYAVWLFLLKNNYDFVVTLTIFIHTEGS